MKKRTLLALWAMASWAIIPSYAQEKGDTPNKVEQAIEHKEFTIQVNQAIPQRGESRMLTSEYSLTVKNDSIFSHLPYFGVSYSIPYGGGKGLIFKESLLKYEVQKKKKKGEVKVLLETRNDEDRYQYNLSIFPNGKTTISVQPTNRQGITYYGEMELEE